MKTLMATAALLIAISGSAYADSTGSSYIDNPVLASMTEQEQIDYWRNEALTYKFKVEQYQNGDHVISQAEQDLRDLKASIAAAGNAEPQKFGNVIQKTKDEGTYNGDSYDKNSVNILTHYQSGNYASGTVREVTLTGNYNKFTISTDIQINNNDASKFKALIASVNNKAYDEGYKDGFNDGYEVGFNDGWDKAIDSIR